MSPTQQLHSVPIFSFDRNFNVKKIQTEAEPSLESPKEKTTAWRDCPMELFCTVVHRSAGHWASLWLEKAVSMSEPAIRSMFWIDCYPLQRVVACENTRSRRWKISFGSFSSKEKIVSLNWWSISFMSIDGLSSNWEAFWWLGRTDWIRRCLSSDLCACSVFLVCIVRNKASPKGSPWNRRRLTRCWGSMNEEGKRFVAKVLLGDRTENGGQTSPPTPPQHHCRCRLERVEYLEEPIMSGFNALSKPLKPRSEVAVHTIHPTLEQKPRSKYNVPDWFNHK